MCYSNDFESVEAVVSTLEAWDSAFVKTAQDPYAERSVIRGLISVTTNARVSPVAITTSEKKIFPCWRHSVFLRAPYEGCRNSW
jgi:hypothetical protein